MKRGKCPTCETYGIGNDELEAVRNAKHSGSCEFASKPKTVKKKKIVESTSSVETE